MRFVSKRTLIKGLADVSINLASGWFGLLLISPGFIGVSLSKYLELLLINLPPAIFAFLVGIFLSERNTNL